MKHGARRGFEPLGGTGGGDRGGPQTRPASLQWCAAPCSAQRGRPEPARATRFGAARRKTSPASTIRGLNTSSERPAVKSQFPQLDDRGSRLIIALGAGVLVFALVMLFSLLFAHVDDDSDSSSRRCPGVAGTVDPVTCLPYAGSGYAHASTNNSGSSAQQQPRQKVPAAKVPAAPKAPAAPAPKAPATPPRVSFGKR
jgi:hypothetical protein